MNSPIYMIRPEVRQIYNLPKDHISTGSNNCCVKQGGHQLYTRMEECHKPICPILGASELDVAPIKLVISCSSLVKDLDTRTPEILFPIGH